AVTRPASRASIASSSAARFRSFSSRSRSSSAFCWMIFTRRSMSFFASSGSARTSGACGFAWARRVLCRSKSCSRAARSCSRRPGGGLCPLLLEDGDGVLRFLLELCDPRGSLLVTGLEIGLRGNERPSLLLERLSYFRIGFRLGLLRFLVGTRRELFRDFEG